MEIEAQWREEEGRGRKGSLAKEVWRRAKAALSKGAENARKAMEAEQKKAEEKKENERAIAAAVRAARDEMLADKRAEEELRATFMIPWPSLWKRGWDWIIVLRGESGISGTEMTWQKYWTIINQSVAGICWPLSGHLEHRFPFPPFLEVKQAPPLDISLSCNAP